MRTVSVARSGKGDDPPPSRSLTAGALGVAVRLADALQGRELPGERLRVGNVESGDLAGPVMQLNSEQLNSRISGAKKPGGSGQNILAVADQRPYILAATDLAHDAGWQEPGARHA